MEFWRYYRVLRRRRWLILGLVLGVVAAVGASYRPGTTDFESSATMTTVTPEGRELVIVTTAGEASPDIQAALALDLIRSRTVAERVVQRFNLDTSPAELQLRTRAEKDRGSNLIRVTVTAKSPQEAIALANAVAEAAAAYHQEVSRREGTLNKEFVESQATEVRGNLLKAEDTLLTFVQKNPFVQLAPKFSQVASMESDVERINATLQEIGTRLSSQAINSPVAQRLRTQLVDLEVAILAELAVHTEKHPNVVALRVVKDRLTQDMKTAVSAEWVGRNPDIAALDQSRINLETDRQALLARKEALQRGINEARRQFPELSQKELEHARQARDVEILSKQYADLQARLSDARIKEQELQNHRGSLTVIDHATTAQPASFRGLRFRLTLASVLATLGGAALAFLLEYLDDTVKTPQDAERLVGVPALVAIPIHNPPFDEAYRLLRATLAAKHNGALGVIVVSSPKPQGGTSTVVENLARAFAEAGERTIVVDAALRRPVQHVLFPAINEKGLAEVLAGETTVGDVLVETRVPNLWLLPSGHAQKDPGGLLASRAMVGLLVDLKRRADVILVDTSPAVPFADVMAIAPQATGVLLVLRGGEAPRGLEERIKTQFDRVGAKVLGVVLNRVRPEFVDSYFYQERFYHKPARRRLPAVVAIIGLVMVAVTGILVSIYFKPATAKGSSLPGVERSVIQWVSSLTMPRKGAPEVNR